MPRKPRFYIPDVPVHVVQRGHSREPVFFENSTANMVKHPNEYPWTSYPSNAEGRNIKMIKPHRVYEGLGRSDVTRQAAYRAFFDAHLSDDIIHSIKISYETGTPLGNEFFKEKIEQKLKCKVGQSRRGRPAKRALTP